MDRNGNEAELKRGGRGDIKRERARERRYSCVWNHSRLINTHSDTQSHTLLTHTAKPWQWPCSSISTCLCYALMTPLVGLIPDMHLLRYAICGIDMCQILTPLSVFHSAKRMTTLNKVLIILKRLVALCIIIPRHLPYSNISSPVLKALMSFKKKEKMQSLNQR